MKMKVWIVSLFAMALLSGCASKQNMQQVGGTGVSWTSFEIELMRDTPKIEPIQCPISMLKEYRYLVEQKWAWYRADKWFSDEKPSQFFTACPDPRMDERSQIHLASWEPVRMQWQDSPFRVVGPGVANMFGYVAAAGTLGAVMPSGTTMQSVNGSQTQAVKTNFESPGAVIK